MTHSYETDWFPVPRASTGFYAAFLFRETIRSTNPLQASGQVRASTLERETRANRAELLKLSDADLNLLKIGSLRNTARLALRELGVERNTAVSVAELEQAQAYLLGPVEETGVDFARQLGWLRGETPENPFRYMVVLSGVLVQPAPIESSIQHSALR